MNTIPPKRHNVIQDLIRAMESGYLSLTDHAIKRMTERDIVLSDIEEAILNCSRIEHKDSQTDDGSDWKYAVQGRNANGQKDIRIVFFFDDPRAVVVTVIDKEK